MILIICSNYSQSVNFSKSSSHSMDEFHYLVVQHLNLSTVMKITYELSRQVDGETRVGIFAGRSIEPGEQLTYDYRYLHITLSSLQSSLLKIIFS